MLFLFHQPSFLTKSVVKCILNMVSSAFKRVNENQFLMKLFSDNKKKIPHPMNSCSGCPVGTWGVSQVNLMKNCVVIGRWMPSLTKARLNEGSGVKIALAFASGPPLPGSLDITSYQIYICNNKLTPIALSGDQDLAGNVRCSWGIVLWNLSFLWRRKVRDWKWRDTRTKERTEKYIHRYEHIEHTRTHMHADIFSYIYNCGSMSSAQSKHKFCKVKW